MKLIEKMKLLLIMLGFKMKVCNVKYRRSIRLCFIIEKYRYGNTITSINVFKKKDKTTIIIETHTPHILIGLRGKFIKGLTNYLIKDLKEDIEIKVVECGLWDNLYKK